MADPILLFGIGFFFVLCVLAKFTGAGFNKSCESIESSGSEVLHENKNDDELDYVEPVTDMINDSPVADECQDVTSDVNIQKTEVTETESSNVLNEQEDTKIDLLDSTDDIVKTDSVSEVAEEVQIASNDLETPDDTVIDTDITELYFDEDGPSEELMKLLLLLERTIDPIENLIIGIPDEQHKVTHLNFKSKVEESPIDFENTVLLLLKTKNNY